MKITSVRSVPASIAVKPDKMITNWRGSHGTSAFVLVRVETDAGIEGVGEATVMPMWSGETVWSAKTLIDEVLGPLVVGKDPTDIEPIADSLDREVSRNWFTKAAVEMACWDIWGKAEGKPVYELLGGPHRDRTIRCRYSMAAYPPDRAALRARELVAEGFTTIKVKVGPDPAGDVARVRAVRDAVGPKIAVTIDANCGWDTETAIRCCTELADEDLALVEQPTPDGDYDALARVRRAIDPPVMADDMCFDLVNARELLRHEACDCIAVYPGKQGGILRAKQMVELAAEHDVVCSIGSNLEWDVGTAAMGHLVIGCENMKVEVHPGDMLGPVYHEERIVKQPLRIEGPLVTVPDAPGLGVEVDWQKVERFRIPPPRWD